MPNPILCGATICMCSFGMAPSPLNPLPGPPVFASGFPAAAIVGCMPMFSMCMSPSNPAFVAATAAALGVPTPVPCTSVITWIPSKPTVILKGKGPIIAMGDQGICALGGSVSIVSPGQVKALRA